MSTSALNLAALASAAVRGLSPIAAEEVTAGPGDRFQVGFVEDDQHRRWTVRVPRDAVAAAQQESSCGLLTLLARRVPFAVPAPAGFVRVEDGRRAMVYPLIPGAGLDFEVLPAGPGVAVELGQLIAAVHNIDRRIYDEAAVPAYDAEETRRRHLVLVDRGAATRRIPTGLLGRWERLLDDISLWRFAPAPLHGRLEGDHVLATTVDEDGVSVVRVRALVGWERARIGDPAEDFADLVRLADPDAVDSVFEAYALARREEPDLRLIERASLVAELRVLADFLAALTAGDRPALTAAGELLQELDALVGDDEAPQRADEEPIFETVPLTFERASVAGSLYSAGDAAHHVTFEQVSEDEGDPPVSPIAAPQADAQVNPSAAPLSVDVDAPHSVDVDAARSVDVDAPRSVDDDVAPDDADHGPSSPEVESADVDLFADAELDDTQIVPIVTVSDVTEHVDVTELANATEHVDVKDSKAPSPR